MGSNKQKQLGLPGIINNTYFVLKKQLKIFLDFKEKSSDQLLRISQLDRHRIIDICCGKNCTIILTGTAISLCF